MSFQQIQGYATAPPCANPFTPAGGSCGNCRICAPIQASSHSSSGIPADGALCTCPKLVPNAVWDAGRRFGITQKIESNCPVCRPHPAAPPIWPSNHGFGQAIHGAYVSPNQPVAGGYYQANPGSPHQQGNPPSNWPYNSSKPVPTQRRFAPKNLL